MRSPPASMGELPLDTNPKWSFSIVGRRTSQPAFGLCWQGQAINVSWGFLSMTVRTFSLPVLILIFLLFCCYLKKERGFTDRKRYTDCLLIIDYVEVHGILVENSWKSY